MADVNSIQDYFKKLQRVLNFEADFSFLGYKLIKKSKIDDILCCILATLPDSYKKIMKTTQGKRLNSVSCYNLLFDTIKKKFILSSDVYLVDSNSANKYIGAILVSIERDIAFAEKNM